MNTQTKNKIGQNLEQLAQRYRIVVTANLWKTREAVKDALLTELDELKDRIDSRKGIFPLNQEAQNDLVLYASLQSIFLGGEY